MHATADCWTASLELNDAGRKVLTLSRALALIADGGVDGWYVAPFSTGWTVGRKAPDGERYHVLAASEPIMFMTEQSAVAYVRQLLPSGAEIALCVPAKREPRRTDTHARSTRPATPAVASSLVLTGNLQSLFRGSPRHG